MADTLNVSSATSGYQSQSDLLVQTFKQSEQPKIDTLTDKQTTLEKNRTFYNNLYTKVNALYSNIDSFTGEKSNEKFVTRTISSSDSSAVSVSASSEALIGINTVKSNRLASYDILISDRIRISDSSNSVDSGLSVENTHLIKQGSYSFELAVGSKDPVSISISFTGDETKEQALAKIVKAVNDNDDSGVTASLIKDTEESGRITFMAKELGRTNKITFSEAKKGVLDALGLDHNVKSGSSSRTIFSETKAGYKTAIFQDLDANLEINGIPVVRSSNTIDDAIPGVTINLLKPQDADALPVTLTTKVDRDKVESLIQPLLTAYNDTLRFLKSDTSLTRGDTIIGGLYNNLRTIISEAVSRDDSSDLRYLTEAGIKINSDGTIGIGDHDMLQEILEDDPLKVARLFTSPDSFVNKISNTLQNLTGGDGIIQAKTKSLTTQINSTVKRKEDITARIERESESLRKEYESMLSVYLEAQSQYDNFTALQSIYGSST